MNSKSKIFCLVSYGELILYTDYRDCRAISYISQTGIPFFSGDTAHNYKYKYKYKCIFNLKRQVLQIINED